MIDAQCDHAGKLGAIRNQGERQTCLAFVTSDLNSVANSTSHLSVEYLCHHAAKATPGWKPGMGFTMGSVLGAAAKPGQPKEDQYPYQPTAHGAPLTVPSTELAPLFASTFKQRNVAVDVAIKAVQSGKPVGLVLALTQSLFTPVNGIVAYDAHVIPGEYHALIAVGVGKHQETDEQYVLLRNSWGDLWGTSGHAWVPERHIRLHLHEAFSI